MFAPALTPRSLWARRGWKRDWKRCGRFDREAVLPPVGSNAKKVVGSREFHRRPPRWHNRSRGARE